MPTRKEGHFHSSNIPDLAGFVAIVTGGNSGIGYETTCQLAGRNARGNSSFPKIGIPLNCTSTTFVSSICPEEISHTSGLYLQ